MKFQINNDKMKIFSTNQNNADDKRIDKYTWPKFYFCVL